MRFNTSLLHAGTTKEIHGATLPPIYQVSAFENRITKLEGGIASVACASGMAALTNVFLNILQSGDEIVSSARLYGGSIDLFRDLETFGITTKMDRWLL